MNEILHARQLWFDAPGKVAVRECQLPPPAAGEVLVRTLVSAISAGTELLFYRGQAPADIPVDATLSALQQDAAKPRYPLRYGYASVGRIESLGPSVPDSWRGRTVFAFQPHASAFVTPLADLLPVPDGMQPEHAVFYANMETAVTLLLDGAPLIGERVILFGLGVVGLLAAFLLRNFPLARLTCVETSATRRAIASSLGLYAVSPDDLPPHADYDLAFELSGNPAALNAAIASVGFAGRVIVGSWYGQKPVTLDLGGAWHRNRIQISSSQVSTITPGLRGRWDRARRTASTWANLASLNYAPLITHRFALDAANEAYFHLDNAAKTMLQVLFVYPPGADV